MIDTKALREKILDLAMRGKLVPQDPNDEPASELLKRIKAEKEELIKQKKIKRDKNETEIFRGDDGLHYEKFGDGTVREVEVPYELPVGWEWANLGQTFNFQAGKFIKATDIKEYDEDSVYPVYGGNGIRGYYSSFNRKGKYPLIGRQGALAGNINFAEGEFYATEHAVVVDCYSDTSPFWSFYMLSFMNLSQYTTGVAQPGLSVNNLKAVYIAIPPAMEQLRIIKHVKEYYGLIDKVEKEQKDLQQLSTQLKKKVLDIAMQGKLVPQDPNDEPASVLFEKIRAEKQRLFEEGKLKKKDLEEIEIVKDDDNAYYEKLPESWIITNLQRLTNPTSLNDGDWIVSKDMTDISEIKLIQLGSIGYGKYVEKGFKYITEETFQRLNCTEIHKNYLMINRLIADKLFVTILPNIESKLITTVDICWIAPSLYYKQKFLMYQLMASNFQNLAISLGTGTTRLRISKGNLIKISINLPPLKEQERITRTIDKYFELIDLTLGTH